MIELDYDELDNAAQLLAKIVVNHVSSAHRLLSPTAYSQFQGVAYKNAFAYISADVPCSIQISSELFETVVKNSKVPYLQSASNTSTLDEDVAGVINVLDFTPYAPENASETSDPVQRLQRVKNEMMRCKEAVANRDDYYVQHLFDNTLSMEADKHNAQVFEKYFKQLQHGEAMHKVCPEDLKEYVRNLVEQASKQQQIVAQNWSFKTSLDQRRSAHNVGEASPPALKN